MSRLPNLGSYGAWRSALRVIGGIVLQRAGGTVGDGPQIIVGTGAPVDATTLVDGNVGIYLREDASDRDLALYITANGGTNWEAFAVGGTGFASLIFDAATELTIAAGAITATQGYHPIDTEADAASDA